MPGTKNISRPKKDHIPTQEVSQTVPVIAEKLKVTKHKSITGKVRISKRVNQRVEVVDQPSIHEKVHIERVPLNRMIDEPAQIRQEGDTTIIPVMEEVLVLEKHLVLKEEIRIRREKVETHKTKEVTLRSEEPVIEHIEVGSDPSTGRAEKQ